MLSSLLVQIWGCRIFRLRHKPAGLDLKGSVRCCRSLRTDQHLTPPVFGVNLGQVLHGFPLSYHLALFQGAQSAWKASTMLGTDLLVAKLVWHAAVGNGRTLSSIPPTVARIVLFALSANRSERSNLPYLRSKALSTCSFPWGILFEWVDGEILSPTSITGSIASRARTLLGELHRAQILWGGLGRAKFLVQGSQSDKPVLHLMQQEGLQHLEVGLALERRRFFLPSCGISGNISWPKSLSSTTPLGLATAYQLTSLQHAPWHDIDQQIRHVRPLPTVLSLCACPSKN